MYLFIGVLNGDIGDRLLQVMPGDFFIFLAAVFTLAGIQIKNIIKEDAVKIELWTSITVFNLKIQPLLLKQA